MMKKGILVLAALGLCHIGYSFEFRPAVSLLRTHIITNNYNDVKAGVFDVQNRQGNWGLELTGKFHIRNQYFIKTGIRYGTYATAIHAKNQMPERFDRPAPLSWERRYQSFAIPFLSGKDFVTRKGNEGSVYAGVSAGMLLTSYAMAMVSYPNARDADNLDFISSEIRDVSNQTPSFTWLTADVGASYQPFKKMPRFSLGVLCSVQLIRTRAVTYQGLVANTTTKQEFKYYIEHAQRFINGSVLLSYDLGRKKK